MKKKVPEGFGDINILHEFLKSIFQKLDLKEDLMDYNNFFGISLSKNLGSVTMEWENKDQELAEEVIGLFDDYCQNILLELDL